MSGRRRAAWLGIAAATLVSCAHPPTLETVVRPSSSSPLVAVRLVVRAGSAHDPPGKEGLAALTGLMLARAATERRTYPEILDALYPTAARIEVRTDREVTLFETTAHIDTLSSVTDLLVESLTRPAFDREDFERNRDQLAAELDSLTAEDELLGLELLQEAVFAHHPYGHAPAGAKSSLAALEPADVRSFFARRYTRDRMLLGIGGGAPASYAESLARRLAVLPPPDDDEEDDEDAFPPPPRPDGRRITLVRKPTTGVGIHLGFPLSVTRADPDWAPLLVATTILGDHRTFHGRLMQELRSIRGLNYGDYAYQEYLDDPPEATGPTPNVPRRYQYFSIWLRPVPPASAPFALRAALYELDRLCAEGVSEDEVASTRAYLRDRSRLWALDASTQIGFALDDRFYRVPPLQEELDRRLAEISAADVNDAIRAHLQTRDLEIVLVGGDPERLRTAILDGPAQVPDYPGSASATNRTRDRAIASLRLEPSVIRIVSADELFASPGF